MKNWKIFMGIFFLTASAVLFLWKAEEYFSYTNPAQKPFKIGISLYKGDDEFISEMGNEFETEVKQLEEEFGRKISLKIVDAKNNQATQNAQVDNFIRNDYDAIAINMVDRTVAANIIDKVKQSGIPLVFFNREPVSNDMYQWSNTYYVGASPQESGEMQGQIVVDAYTENPDSIDINKDGKISYVMLEGEETHQDSLIRSEFSIKQIVDSGIKVEKLTRGVGTWLRQPGYELMKQWLQTYGSEIELVISNNDAMALGAIEAIQEANMAHPPKVVGIDGTKEGLEAVDAGKMLGTVINDGLGQAQAILSASYVAGSDLDKREYLPDMQNQYIWVKHRIYRK